MVKRTRKLQDVMIATFNGVVITGGMAICIMPDLILHPIKGIRRIREGRI